MKLLVINGPNLNFLGIREKGIYGTQDYQYLVNLIEQKAQETGCEIEVWQSNHENRGNHHQSRCIYTLFLCDS